MAFRDTSSFGKRIEYKIIAQMLMDGLDVYTPLIDDHGVDCIIKKPDGTFVEIQIKARSKTCKQNGFFSVDNHKEAMPNFYFVFYSELVDKMWVFSSEEFVNLSIINKGGKHAGRRKLTLAYSSGKTAKKFDGYIRNNLSFLK